MEWEHYCDKMPEEIDGICKFDFSSTSQVTLRHYIKGVAAMDCSFYGFEYCPYCGEKLGELNV